MKAKLTLINNLENQETARKIRDANRSDGNPLQVSFNEDLSEIILEGEKIVIPAKDWISDEISIEGQLKEKSTGYEVFPREKGKTVNLHLDAELVEELEQIRNHVKFKTQHDLLLELFKKGLDQYKEEKK